MSRVQQVVGCVAELSVVLMMFESFRRPRARVRARDALAKLAGPPTASRLAKIIRDLQLQRSTHLLPLTSAAITMVCIRMPNLLAMPVLMRTAVRLQGLQPHAGAPHPEARPQHLCWRVW